LIRFFSKIKPVLFLLLLEFVQKKINTSDNFSQQPLHFIHASSPTFAA